MKMRKLFVVFLALASFSACQEAPKNNETTDPKVELAAITDVVHNFYKWYPPAGIERIEYVDSEGEFSKLDMAKVAAYHAQMMKSGFLSQAFIDNDMAYLKKYEAIWAKGKENGNEFPLSGLDYDRFLCSQEIEDFKLLTTAPVEVQGLGTEKVIAILDLEDYTAKKFELVKENGKWLISKITCN